jgi:ABC-type uncharacterized transport system YnjBCD ATPase subunit
VGRHDRQRPVALMIVGLFGDVRRHGLPAILVTPDPADAAAADGTRVEIEA